MGLCWGSRSVESQAGRKQADWAQELCEGRLQPKGHQGGKFWAQSGLWASTLGKELSVLGAGSIG